MCQDTNDNKLMEIDNSIKQQKIEQMAQVEGIQKKQWIERKSSKLPGQISTW